MARQDDHNVYIQLMSTLGYGYPLWFPDHDPNLPPTYPKDGTRIGDLGYLTDEGDFEYLFNVCTDASNPSNSGRVPPDFVPLTDIPEPAVEKQLEMHEKNKVLTASSERQLSMRPDQNLPYVFTCVF